MTALLAPHIADRLAKLCGLFGSHHDGERASAARKADELVRELGLTWRDIVMPVSPPVATMPPPVWQRMASFCFAHRARLNERELEFIENMLRMVRSRREPSDRQHDWLAALYARVWGGGR
jgi:hypothetical protein